MAYTYYLKFKPNNKKYYGVKFSKNCSPDDLWVSYFTSSKVVKDLIKKYGKDSFEAYIDKIFDTPEEAIKYELEKLQSIEDKSNWLNENFGTGYDVKKILYKTEEHKCKISQSNKKPKTGKALKACIENAKLGAEARKGMKDSIETKRKRAESVRKATAGVPKPWLNKKIIIEDQIYFGVGEVALKYNISRQTVHNRIKSKDWNWHYATVK